MSTFNIAEIIQVAYEISDCNEEGMTDADEAIRIWCERTGYELPLPIAEIKAAINHEFGG